MTFSIPEPTEQLCAAALRWRLADAGHKVSIETNITMGFCKVMHKKAGVEYSTPAV